LQRQEARLTEQPLLGLPPGGVVRHALQAEHGAQVAEIAQQGADASVVGFEELYQHQAGKPLRLGVALRRVFGRIGRQRLLPNLVLPSMSVKRKVTVPDGGLGMVGFQRKCHRLLQCQRAALGPCRVELSGI
jgi:hypothetical protein